MRGATTNCWKFGIPLWDRNRPHLSNHSLDGLENAIPVTMIEYKGMQVQLDRRIDEQFYAGFYKQDVPG